MKYSYGIVFERNGNITKKTFDADSSDIRTENEFEDIRLKANITKSPFTLTVSAVNLGHEPIVIKEITAFSTEFENLIDTENAGEIQIFTDWDQIWHFVGMTNSDDSIWNMKRTRAIYNGGLVRRSDAMGVAMAFETPHDFESSIRFEDGKVTALEYVGKELAAKNTLTIDSFRISDYQHFGKALSSLHEHETSRRDIGKIREYFGYNTWEAYGDDITPENIFRELETIKNVPLLRENIKYFIIDDGWQSTDGYWYENEKFADLGMANIAKKIRSAGLIPGIWTSPFIVNGNSKFVEQHPEMLLKDPNGKFVQTSPKNPIYILDISHPDVKEFISNLYKRLYDWGYRYFKTDFLKDAVQPMIHGNPEFVENILKYDMTVTPEESMNEINRIIRDALGDDSFWMGCGTQLTTNCDLMDASRTGGDISPRWSRVPMQASAVVWRLLCNGHRFLADPDFTVLSSHSTLYREGFQQSWLDRESMPYKINAFSGPLFSENEARTWLSFIIISGGIVNLSDRLHAFKPLAYDLLEVVYKYAGGAGFMPVDADKTLPRIFTRPHEDKTLIGIFNWDDEDAEITIPFGSGILNAPETAENIWTGEKIDIDGKPLTVKLGARSALVWEY